jgi:hypothetical protein
MHRRHDDIVVAPIAQKSDGTVPGHRTVRETGMVTAVGAVDDMQTAVEQEIPGFFARPRGVRQNAAVALGLRSRQRQRHRFSAVDGGLPAGAREGFTGANHRHAQDKSGTHRDQGSIGHA